MNHAHQAAPARAPAAAPALGCDQPHRAGDTAGAPGAAETVASSRTPTPDNGGTVASERWETDGGAVWTG
ncbi:hypothetical protein [Pseudonocardia parietis]|uniref:Uncharacterized protein n=1 Tax=Pseudonocardia parietis TaxID=570936 RepID=A0ABS4W033_9PSEU|nr:hypothetical protein [Pseudonocardia parietis]MBP2369540.1 hypothetical protein [Pseudonocardia parietis]